MSSRRAIAVVTMLLLAAAGDAAERYSGDAYSSATDALLYHETHYLYDDGQRLVVYRCPDGGAFARKHVRASADAQAPDFDLVDAHLGYREGVREGGGGREVYVQRRPSAPEQAEPLKLPADGVIDAGLDVFARKHWSELLGGATLHFPYLVPSRRKFFDFDVQRVDDPQVQPGTMLLRLTLRSWFGFLVPHIDVVYDLNTQRIVRYEGLSSIRDDRGKNYRIRAVYPPVGASRIAQAEVDAALAEPLVAACTPADKLVSAGGQPAMPEVTSAAAARNQNP